MKRRSVLAASPGLLGLAGGRAPAQSQAWPARPLRVIVAYPPGGVSDEAARALAEALARQLGVAVTVENKPGAGGAVAFEALTRAVPDGHTLCFSAISPFILSPEAGRPAFGLDEVAPVFAVMHTPQLIVATPAFSGSSFAEVLAQARRQPGKLRWASSGLATTGHLILEQVRALRQLDITHVPYKGGGQQLTDALSGQFELLSTNVGGQQLAYIREGRLKPLAVGAPARVAALPEVPTLAELGLPQANLASVFGLFAPGRTPPERVGQVNAALEAALQRSGLRERLLAADNQPIGGSAAEFTRLIQREAENIRRLRGRP